MLLVSVGLIVLMVLQILSINKLMVVVILEYNLTINSTLIICPLKERQKQLPWNNIKQCLTLGFVWLLWWWMPAQFPETRVQCKQSMILPSVRAHFNQLAACLHVVQAVRRYNQRNKQHLSICRKVTEIRELEILPSITPPRRMVIWDESGISVLKY